MAIKQNVPFERGAKTDKCPVCGHPVRIVYRDNEHADHYEPLTMRSGWRAPELQPVDPDTAKKLHKIRAGKRTIACVGMAPTSCSLAPYEDPDVEIWALNEMHVMPWMKRWDRWFQIHASQSWKRRVAKRGVVGHYEWLKEDHGKPIVMQYWNPEIPGSEAYPLAEICEKLLGSFSRGDDHVKYFTSSLSYMIGYALWSEKVDRIEIYGFELNDQIEFVKQKACAEFWIGLAMGRGVEVYAPPNCTLLWSSLYGGNEQGDGW